MITQNNSNCAALLSEANGSYSRDNVTLLTSPAVYAAGSVLKFASGKYSLAAAADTAVAVLMHLTDAVAGDAKAVAVVRDAELVAEELVYDASVNDDAKKAAKIAQLKAAGLIVR